MFKKSLEECTFLRGLKDGVPATGFEFSFSFSEHEGPKDDGETKAEVMEPQEAQLPEPDVSHADKTGPWRWDAEVGEWRSGPDRHLREGSGNRRKPFTGVALMVVLLIATFVRVEPIIALQFSPHILSLRIFRTAQSRKASCQAYSQQ